MGFDYLNLVIVLGTTLFPSLVFVYFSLRSLGWKKNGRILSAMFVWLVWLMVVIPTYIGILSQRVQFGFRGSMTRIMFEFVALLLVGLLGLLSVFVTTRFLRRRQTRTENVGFESLEGLVTPNTTLHASFFINLAAIAGLGGSLAVGIILDDIYRGRISASEHRICPAHEVCFGIYD